MIPCEFNGCHDQGGDHDTLGLCPYHYEKARLFLGINYNPKHL